MTTDAKPKRQGCGDCEHAEHVAPFKIWCKAGEGMMGDIYASGMLVNSRCVKNRAEIDPGGND